MVEILDDGDNRPCPPGRDRARRHQRSSQRGPAAYSIRTGRYRQRREPCPCGRGLTVLTKVQGRVRNLFTLPDGTTFSPSLPSSAFIDILHARWWQVAQVARDAIEVRFQPQQNVTQEDHTKFRRLIADTWSPSLQVAFKPQAAPPKASPPASTSISSTRSHRCPRPEAVPRRGQPIRLHLRCRRRTFSAATARAVFRIPASSRHSFDAVPKLRSREGAPIEDPRSTPSSKPHAVQMLFYVRGENDLWDACKEGFQNESAAAVVHDKARSQENLGHGHDAIGHHGAAPFGGRPRLGRGSGQGEHAVGKGR